MAQSTTKGSGRGGPRPGSGPKRKPAGEKLAHRVVAFFNREEFAYLKALAKEQGGVSLGAAARSIVRRSLKRRGGTP
jgi:hypothetical protein